MPSKSSPSDSTAMAAGAQLHDAGMLLSSLNPGPNYMVLVAFGLRVT